MSDFWSDLATPVTEAVATPEPPKPRRQTRGAGWPADLGTIPLADAWLLFRVGDDGLAEDVRVARGSHLNRLRNGEARDWDRDIALHAFTPDDVVPALRADMTWRAFLSAWQIAPEALAAAMREAARIEGLEWLYGQAERYEEATRG